ncbi:MULTISPECIES: hypothetical protein [unclassified Hyphomicrobium]|uniref:hypothetical protein n=1 Tax=unclassified Hyphomicrobium TaxID=2619925 RepID=UPI0012DD9614|nr:MULTISPECIES: hypothetical protein [unclassified Hyphomicrobium]
MTLQSFFSLCVLEKGDGHLLLLHGIRSRIRASELHWRIFRRFPAASSERECGNAYSKRDDFHDHLPWSIAICLDTHVNAEATPETSSLFRAGLKATGANGLANLSRSEAALTGMI